MQKEANWEKPIQESMPETEKQEASPKQELKRTSTDQEKMILDLFYGKFIV